MHSKIQAEESASPIWVTPREFSQRTGTRLDTVQGRMRNRKFKPYIRNSERGLEIHAEAFEKLVDKSMSRNTAEFRARKKEQNLQPQKKNPMEKDKGGNKYRFTSKGPLPDASHRPGFSGEAGITDYLEEKRKWSARFEELKYKKHLREAVSTKSVIQEAASIARMARDQLLQIPDRVSGQLINVHSYDEIFAVLNGEINRVLIELTRSIEKINIDDTVEITTDPSREGNRPHFRGEIPLPAGIPPLTPSDDEEEEDDFEDEDPDFPPLDEEELDEDDEEEEDYF